MKMKRGIEEEDISVKNVLCRHAQRLERSE
jgi:hypothetical protein